MELSIGCKLVMKLYTACKRSTYIWNALYVYDDAKQLSLELPGVSNPTVQFLFYFLSTLDWHGIRIFHIDRYTANMDVLIAIMYSMLVMMYTFGQGISTPLFVIIFGQSGSGKSSLVNFLHNTGEEIAEENLRDPMTECYCII